MHTTATTEDIPVALGPLLRLAAPVVLSRLGIMAMGLTDTLIVGRHSATELGYQALGWAPTAVVLTTSIGLLSGVQVMTSQAIGEGRAADTGAILRRGIAYSLWVGLLAAAVLGILGGPFMHHIGLTTDLANGATPVLQLFALSLIPILIADTGIFWLEAHGRPIRGMVAMWGANLVNLVLNLWLVPGTSLFAVEGATASAWATLGARVALLVAVAALIIGWRQSRALGVYQPAPHAPAAAAEMRRIGYGASLSNFVETTAFAAMSIYAGWLGVVAVATWAIVLNMAALIFMVPLGLAVATSVLVGRSWGADDLPAVRRAGLLGFGVTFAVTLAICAIVGLGADRIAAAYTLDSAVRTATTTALLLSCLFYVADGLQVVAAQSLRARGDVWVPSLTHSISYVVVMMPLAYYLAFPIGLGVPGIVWAIIAASFCAAALLLTRFFWTARGLHHG